MEEADKKNEEDAEQNMKKKEELKKSEECGSLYYENWRFAVAMPRAWLVRDRRRRPIRHTRHMPSTQSLRMRNGKGGGRKMSGQRGYTAYNGKVEMDPRSPKCWAFNQRTHEKPSYSPTSASYDPPQTDGREREMTPSYSPTLPCDHLTPSHSPRLLPRASVYADLLHSRGSGQYSQTAPCYSRTFQDAGTSYSLQPMGNQPCIDEGGANQRG
jgi:hypothetical protein